MQYRMTFLDTCILFFPASPMTGNRFLPNFFISECSETLIYTILVNFCGELY